MRFKRKPIEIDAIRWDGTNTDEVRDFCGWDCWESQILYIHTLEGKMEAKVGDWIVKGIAGEFYPVKPDIFDQIYEAAK